MARFQILAISGGGYLGLFAAGVLAELERKVGEPLARRFDLIVGTSIGGIIGLALAAERDAASISNTFVARGPKIFSTRRPPQGKLARTASLWQNAFHAKYSSDELAAAIDDILPASTRIGDLRHRFIAPAVNLTTGRPKLFKTDHHVTFESDHLLKARDVALATSAAPTIFPVHQIDRERFADGGMFANAPDLLGLHEATKFLGQSVKEVSILSVGTTTAKFSLSHNTSADMGWMSWMGRERLISVMIAAQQSSVQDMLRHQLEDRYERIDAERSPEQEKNLSLDSASASATADLLGLAAAAAREHSVRPSIMTMLKHQPPPPKFYHRGGAGA